MTQKFSEISPEMVLLLFVTLGYGLLGFLDDYIKVVMKRNLGLTSKQKLIGQIIIAVVFYAVYHYYNFATDIRIPGTDLSFDRSWLGLLYPCALYASRRIKRS